MKKVFLILIIFIFSITSFVLAYEMPSYILTCDLDIGKIDSYNQFNNTYSNITKEQYYSNILKNNKICISQNCSFYFFNNTNYSYLTFCRNNDCLDTRTNIDFNKEKLIMKGRQHDIDFASKILEGIGFKNISIRCYDGSCPNQNEHNSIIPTSYIVFCFTSIVIISIVLIFFIKKRN